MNTNKQNKLWVYVLLGAATALLMVTAFLTKKWLQDEKLEQGFENLNIGVSELQITELLGTPDRIIRENDKVYFVYHAHLAPQHYQILLVGGKLNCKEILLSP